MTVYFLFFKKRENNSIYLLVTDVKKSQKLQLERCFRGQKMRQQLKETKVYFNLLVFL